MKVAPLLGIQRDLYQVEAPARFTTYLDTMLMPNRQDIRLPLQNMNPMAKEHVPKLLDKLLLELDAEAVASDCVAEHMAHATLLADDSTMTRYSDIAASYPFDLSLVLVVVDDAKGGWTDRVDIEFKNAFEMDEKLQRGWIETILWSSDADPTSESTRLATDLAVHRAICRIRDEKMPDPETLKDMLDQESWVWRQQLEAATDAGISGAEGAIDILKKYQTATKSDAYPTIVAAYFGDEAAEARGFPSLGMDGWSGKDICRLGLWN